MTSPPIPPTSEVGIADLVELVVVIGLPLLLLGSVRVGLRHEQLVVVRAGRIVRATASRLILILPGLEQTRRWPTGAIDVPVLARASTRDGLAVQALATCEIELHPPVVGQRYADPARQARDLIEVGLAEAIAARDVAGLFDPALGLGTALALIDLPMGRIVTVEVDGVDALLGSPGAAPA